MDNNLCEAVFRRKSTRKYRLDPLPPELLEEIKTYAAGLTPLFVGIRTGVAISGEIRNFLPFSHPAPHYMLFLSETGDDALVNAGFMIQQMDLFLSSKGLGSCWLGLSRPVGKPDEPGLHYVAALEFGYAVGSPHRQLTEFRRKPLSEISSGDDERIEWARLAPSATNSQNWYFAAENGSIHVYNKSPNAVSAIMMAKMNSIDAGIAICHLALATTNQGRDFAFARRSGAPELKHYTYIGTVS